MALIDKVNSGRRLFRSLIWPDPAMIASIQKTCNNHISIILGASVPAPRQAMRLTLPLVGHCERKVRRKYNRST
ncbi:hypothetical protein [Mesorhizobium sanjuanii]|uniref:hypothetical protein n=1 Tax=Mesorhizobium sanjuanii TaxID=2037900 RepID=UPI0013FD158E|nr:hypothetical protein [Mesorhizobium sanjuanii]